MNFFKTVCSGAFLACLSAASVSAMAGPTDYSGDYAMECESVTRNIGVAFVYGDIDPAEGAVILSEADARGAYFPVDFEACGDFSFGDLDSAKIDEIHAAAKDKCIATEMPIDGFVKEVACTIAADKVKESLTLTSFPDPQDYIAPYVTNSIGLDVSCALKFFSWCLQYGSDTSYSFSAGNSLYYHAYINGKGEWLETFALDNVLQSPNLPCKSMTQVVLRGDANEDSSLSTTSDMLDGHVCAVANPNNVGEVVSVILGMDVTINQTGAK